MMDWLVTKIVDIFSRGNFWHAHVRALKSLDNKICENAKILFFQEITLREGSRFAEVWAKPPIKPYLKVYFFNVTNPRRFLKGAKPRLREVGPFVYE